jgi:peptide/nickel transport system substrate-binding protein
VFAARWIGKGGGGRLAQLTNAFLARGDEREVVVPYLAEKLPSQDDGTWIVNPDGTMQTIWTLRADIKWHDGESLTAHDVAFAYRVYRDRDLPIEEDLPERYMSGVVARDSRTFEVSWNQLYFEAGQPREGDLAPLPRHLLEDLYNTGDKVAFANSSFFTSVEYIGAGPYRVAEWERGVRLTLAANPHFFLGKPKIDVFEYTVVADRNAVVARLLAGDLDFAEHDAIDTQSLVVLREHWRNTQEGTIVPSQQQTRLAIFQQRDVPNHQAALKDVRVRRALVHALDRDALADVGTNGFTHAADTSTPANHPLFPRMDAAVMKYPFDLRRAEQLFEEAGWRKGADSMLRSAGGQFFDLEIFNISSVPPFAIAMGDYWRRAGINATTPVTAVARGDSQPGVSFPGVKTQTKPSFRFHDTIAAELPSEEIGWRGRNESSWVHPEYEALYARFSRSVVPAERDELAVQLERIVTTDVGTARLFNEVRPAAMRNNFRGLKGLAGGNLPTHLFNLHEWSMQ